VNVKTDRLPGTRPFFALRLRVARLEFRVVPFVSRTFGRSRCTVHSRRRRLVTNCVIEGGKL